MDSEGIFVNAGKAGGSGQTGAVPQEPWEEGDMENVVKAARRVLARSQVHEPRTPNPVCSAGANVPITPHGGPATERPVTRGPGGGAFCVPTLSHRPHGQARQAKDVPDNRNWGACEMKRVCFKQGTAQQDTVQGVRGPLIGTARPHGHCDPGKYFHSAPSVLPQQIPPPSCS